MDTNYLLVGGGMTADAAVKGIREHDAGGSIVLVGAEPHPPYKRPPLTKGLWSGGDEAKIWKRTADAGVEVILGRRIVALDLEQPARPTTPATSTATRSSCSRPAARPRRLGGADDGVVYFRTLDDYRQLRELADGGAHVVVIGGGFIGSELAAVADERAARR